MSENPKISDSDSDEPEIIEEIIKENSNAEITPIVASPTEEITEQVTDEIEPDEVQVTLTSSSSSSEFKSKVELFETITNDLTDSVPS